MALHLKSTGIDWADFSDSSAGTPTSELMDDYEEGTWSPIVADTNDGDQMTHTTQTAGYTHIGRVCFVSGIVVTNAISHAAGAIRLQGYPFTSGNTNAALAALNIGYAAGFSITSTVSVVLRISGNSTVSNFHKWESTGGVAAFTAAEWTNDGQIQFGGSYATSA